MTYMIFLSSVILLLTVGTFAIQNSFADTTDLPENVSASIVQAANTVDTTPPLLTSLELRTSNTDSTRAKQGDIILIALYTDTHLSNASATILNRTVETDIIVSVVLFETIILAGDSGNTSFSVTVYDSSGNGLTITEADITSNNIFIDTAKPVITLNGPANITIKRGMEYVDAGVMISDNDPTYNGIVSSNATSLDTNYDGTYTIVYSAPPDLAGNKAKNATRTIIISPLLEIYNVAINTTNPNPGYAKENDMLVIRLESDLSLANTSVSATVFGRQADYNIYDQILYVNQTVKKGDNGYVPLQATDSKQHLS